MNALLMVRPEFRKQGFARTIYAAEDELYGRWGVREIWMTAIDDGPRVWVRHFGFRPKAMGVLRADYRSWFRRRQNKEGLPETLPDEPKDIPGAFLDEKPGIDLVKVLGREVCR